MPETATIIIICSCNHKNTLTSIQLTEEVSCLSIKFGKIQTVWANVLFLIFLLATTSSNGRPGFQTQKTSKETQLSVDLNGANLNLAFRIRVIRAPTITTTISEAFPTDIHSHQRIMLLTAPAPRIRSVRCALR